MNWRLWLGGSLRAALIGALALTVSPVGGASLAEAGPYRAAAAGAQPSILSGSVTSLPGGTPFAGARVLIWQTGPNGFFLPSDTPTAIAVSGVDGTWSVPLAPGTYCVAYEDPSGLLLTEFHSGLVIPDPYGTPIHLAEGQTVTIHGHLHERAAVEATVLDVRTGAPLAGVTVHLDRHYPDGFYGDWPLTQRVGTAVSDSSGQIRFASLDPRVNHWLTAEPYGGLVRVFPVTAALSPGSTQVTTLPMSPPGRIRGVAFDVSRGAPIEGIIVNAFDLEGLDSVSSAVTAADGTYVLDGLLTGRYRVSFTDPSGPEGPYGQMWVGGSESGHDTPIDVTVGSETTGVDARFVDALPPVTTSPTSTSWQRGPVEVSLHAQDQGWMGTSQTWFRFSGTSTWTPYTGPFEVSAEGSHEIEYFSQDATSVAGTTNQEAPQRLIVRIDNTAPTTALRAVRESTSVVPPVMDLRSYDRLSGVSYYRWEVDGRPGSGPVVVLGAPGVRTLTYWAVDAAGNIESQTTVALTVTREPRVLLGDGRAAGVSSYRKDPAWPLPGVAVLPPLSHSSSIAWDSARDILYVYPRTSGFRAPGVRLTWNGQALPDVVPPCDSRRAGVGVDSAGTVYLATNDRVTAYTPEGTALWSAQVPPGLTRLWATDAAPDGTVWAYHGEHDRRIAKITEPGAWSTRSIDYTVSDLAASATEVYVGDTTNSRIRVLSTNLDQIREWSTGLAPGSVALDSDGYVYVAFPTEIRKYTPLGGLVESFAIPESSGSIAVDAAGNVFFAGRDGVVSRFIHELLECRVTIEAPAQPAPRGNLHTMRGSITPAATGITVRLEQSTDGGRTWKHARTLSTDAQGRWSLAVPVFAPKKLRASVPSDATLAGAVSATVKLSPGVTVNHLFGDSRYETGVAVSKAAFPAGSASVVIATGTNWPDALSGSALAGALGAPILLVETAAVPESVSAEIARLGARDAYILGGEAAVGREVADALARSGLRVERIAGRDRYETADKVARETIRLLGPEYGGSAFVATGGTFADAVAAGPLAAAQGSPILLVHPTKGLLLSTRAVIAEASEVVVLGGTAAVSSSVESGLVTMLGAAHVVRLGGGTRYDTAALVAAHGVAHAGLEWDRIGVATGVAFPDALAASVLQARRGSVLLLSRGDTLSPASQATLAERRIHIDEITFVGGNSALSPAVRSAARQALE